MTAQVGQTVSVADGYHPDGTSRPRRIGTVMELYGPDQWPRIQFSGTAPGNLQTCSPSSVTGQESGHCDRKASYT